MKNYLAWAAFLLIMVADAGIAQTNGMIRIEQDDPSITYSGDWYTNRNEQHSNGMSVLTNSKGARATVSFTGTGITWIGLTDPWSGLATVYLDGAMHVVDVYSGDTRYQRRLFSAAGMASGPHTLTIDVPHARGPNASGAWVWIDAFEIENGSGVVGGNTATVGRVEQDNPSLIYTGTWYLHPGSAHSGGGAALALDAGSSVTLNFFGTGASWITYGDEWSGLAKVFLDGVFIGNAETYSSPSNAGLKAFSVSSLAVANHSLTIEVTGTHSGMSQGSWVWIDAFDIEGPRR